MQLKKNDVVPTSSQDEALAHYGVSREVHCSALKCETVPDTLRVIFEIASKYCISDSFVDHDGYSISSEGFLPASKCQGCAFLLPVV